MFGGNPEVWGVFLKSTSGILGYEGESQDLEMDSWDQQTKNGVFRMDSDNWKEILEFIWEILNSEGDILGFQGDCSSHDGVSWDLIRIPGVWSENPEFWKRILGTGDGILGSNGESSGMKGNPGVWRLISRTISGIIWFREEFLDLRGKSVLSREVFQSGGRSLGSIGRILVSEGIIMGYERDSCDLKRNPGV